MEEEYLQSQSSTRSLGPKPGYTVQRYVSGTTVAARHCTATAAAVTPPPATATTTAVSFGTEAKMGLCRANGWYSSLCVSWIFTFFLHVLATSENSNSPWATWWDYEGVAGPQHWGIINPEWRMCKTGKFQSPIDIRPQNLLFDPNLRRMNVNIPDTFQGTLVNTGNDLTIRVSKNCSITANFSDGPLMYTYRVVQVKLHFGKTDTEGSEHSVDGNAFAAELQFLAYNTELYKNLSDAMRAPYGIAIIAVFVEASDEENKGFRVLVENAKQVPWQGQTKDLQKLPVRSLLPDTNYYLTYEGSLTQPACHETVTWVLFNKPIYVSRIQLDTLRQFQKRLYGQESVTQLAGNRRPTMPLNNRAVRTNINYPTTGHLCNMKKIVFYQVNPSLTV
ncbi:carbonic anhydrase-related protein 10-like [Littorina saxatilis]|uniref:carbonic anhydrase-related protein 10-like n=1 Tax=Littorina saxatilis TaxID=31220 RepID=UPI0038B59C04